MTHPDLDVTNCWLLASNNSCCQKHCPGSFTVISEEYPCSDFELTVQPIDGNGYNKVETEIALRYSGGRVNRHCFDIRPPKCLSPISYFRFVVGYWKQFRAIWGTYLRADDLNADGEFCYREHQDLDSQKFVPFSFKCWIDNAYRQVRAVFCSCVSPYLEGSNARGDSGHTGCNGGNYTGGFARHVHNRTSSPKNNQAKVERG